MKQKRNVIQTMSNFRCPRCRHRTIVRRHAQITQKLLSKPFYYAYWYVCVNKACSTFTIMLDEAKVFPGQSVRQPVAVTQYRKAPDTLPPLTTHASVPLHTCVKEDCGVLPWELCPYSDTCNPYK